MRSLPDPDDTAVQLVAHTLQSQGGTCHVTKGTTCPECVAQAQIMVGGLQAKGRLRKPRRTSAPRYLPLRLPRDSELDVTWANEALQPYAADEANHEIPSKAAHIAVAILQLNDRLSR